VLGPIKLPKLAEAVAEKAQRVGILRLVGDEAAQDDDRFFVALRVSEFARLAEVIGELRG
jgi:hypothetical protein